MVGKKSILISRGDLYGKLSVIKEVPSRVRHYSGRKRVLRFASVSCVCGNILEVGIAELRGGQRSCGCDSGADGDHASRLYACWTAMRQRAKMRKNCSVYPAWNKYINFKKWALVYGYKEDLILCRNGDKGNYEPNNVRWDTKGNNVKEAQSKTYLRIDSFGEKSLITNMREFCRSEGLSRECVVRVLSGKRRKYKGCRYYKIIATNS